jgi:hypothetical protein
VLISTAGWRSSGTARSPSPDRSLRHRT